MDGIRDIDTIRFPVEHVDLSMNISQSEAKSNKMTIVRATIDILCRCREPFNHMDHHYDA